jgi:hypothetical protein
MAMVLWAHWLRDTGAASAAGVAAELAHLRGNWTTASLGHLLAHVTESETSRISKAIRPSDDEVRLIMAKQRRNLKLPLCFEVLDTLLESHFINLLPRRHTLPALDKIGGFLGAMFATETAQRGANWVGAQACKTKDVRFQLGVGAPDLGFTKEAVGDVARAGIMMGGKTDRLQDILKGVCRIVRVDIDIVNTKQKKSLTVSVERRSEEEAKITEMFGIWLIISGTKDEDPFMTRYGVSKTQWNRQAKSRARKVKPTPDHVAKVTRRLICSSDCSTIIKEGASKLGLPAIHFSMKSCRSAAITIMSSAGADTKTIHQRSGHGSKSKVSKTHYNYHTSQTRGGRGRPAGPAAMAGSSSFGVNELRGLVPSESFKEGHSELGSDEDEEPEETQEPTAIPLVIASSPSRRTSTRRRSAPSRNFPQGLAALGKL